jgi:LPXTG-motif cell wall-anchored protein
LNVARPPASTLWKAAFWICATAVLVLSLAPTAPELPSTGWDKSNHFLGFITLAMLGLQGYPQRRSALFIGLLFFGGLIEMLQSLTTYRFAEWIDWVADGIGVLGGYGLDWIRRRRGQSLRRP